MDKRQEEIPPPPIGHKPNSFDLPSLIVIYTLVIVLGIGLCFCLRKANRLVPNRYSFPLVLRSRGNRSDNNSRIPPRRQQHFDDIDEEESRQGLLNEFSDSEGDNSEHEYNVNTHTHYYPDDDPNKSKNYGIRDFNAKDIDNDNDNDHEDEDIGHDNEEYGNLQQAPYPTAATNKKQVNEFVVIGDNEDDLRDESSGDIAKKSV